MKKKEIRRCCTGLTEEEVKKEMEALGKGKKTPNRCYLCKRPEGGKSVLLAPDEKGPVYAKIGLVPVHREITGGRTFIYFLCWECALLVGLRAKTVGQKKGTQTKNQGPGQILPAGPAGDFYS